MLRDSRQCSKCPRPKWREKCPDDAAGGGIPGGFNGTHNHSRAPHPEQAATEEPHKLPSVPLNRVDEFRCAFCGALTAATDLVGRDGALWFCSQCVAALDGLTGAPIDALTVLRRN